MTNREAPPAVSPDPPPPAVEEPAPATEQPAAPPVAQFLQVWLGEGGLLLPVADLVEILKLAPGQVMPMFQMPPWVMGVYNWRGDMLWVVDLGHFLGGAPWYQRGATQHTVVVVHPAGAAPAGAGDAPGSLGVLVGAVEGMVAYPVGVAAAAPDLEPFWLGSAGPPAGPALPVLDSAALLEGMAAGSRPPL